MPDDRGLISIVDRYITEAIRIRGQFYHTNDGIQQATRSGMNTGIRLMVDMRSEIMDAQRSANTKED